MRSVTKEGLVGYDVCHKPPPGGAAQAQNHADRSVDENLGQVMRTGDLLKQPAFRHLVSRGDHVTWNKYTSGKESL